MSYGSLSFTSQIQNTLMKILSKTCFVFQYFYVLCYLQDFLFFLLFVLFLVILYAVFKVQVQTIPVSPLFLNESLEKSRVVGLSGLEPPTSRLSGVRSNQLSYKPTTGIQDRALKIE